MAIHRFWRTARVKSGRRRRAAPLLPETTGLSGTARRVNRVVAVVALFGAFGTVALAVALTPEGQTPASSAPAPQEDFRISRIEVPSASALAPEPSPVETASLTTTVVAVQPPPEPAPKADRLFSTPRAPDASDSELDEDEGRTLEFGLSEPPPPPEPPEPPAPGEFGDAAVDDASLDEIEEAIEAAIDETSDEVVEDAVVDEAADEPVEQVAEEAVEPAAPEPEAPEQAVAATRTAPVTTDVNLRARPENGAAVILVVPGKSTVEVIGCDYWCEVVYEGQRGWIYKGFVRGS